MSNNIKIGERKYHFAFGWCEVTHPGAEKSVINLDAEKITYYVMGKGDVSYSKKDGLNTVYVPNDELYENDKQEFSEKHRLAFMALNPKIIL